MKKSKLIIGIYIASLGLATTSLALSSYAWYASSANVRVSSVDIAIKSDRNLQVSTDPTTFEDHKFSEGTELNLSLKEDNEVSLKVFKPVSSMYTFEEEWTKANRSDPNSDWAKHPDDYAAYDWYMKKETRPHFAEGFYDYGKKIPEVPLPVTVEHGYEEGYFEKTLYLKADDNVLVTLDPEKTFFSNDHYDKLNDDEKAKLDRLFKSLRFSILVTDEDNESRSDYKYSIIDPNKDGDTVFAGRLNTSTDDYYDYYQTTYVDTDGTTKVKYKETLYGDIDESTRDSADYGDPVATEQDLDDNDSFVSKTSPGVCPLLGLSRVKAAKEHSYALADQGGTSSSFTIPVYRNQPRKIVLDIYMEGWDKDCVNLTMGSEFKTNISFKIAREMNI